MIKKLRAILPLVLLVVGGYFLFSTTEFFLISYRMLGALLIIIALHFYIYK